MRFVYYTRFLSIIGLGLALLSYTHDLHPQEVSVPITEQSDEPHFIIKMESYTFTPSEITVEAGKPFHLTLENESFLVPHNFLLDDSNGTRLVDADISSGETQVISLTLTEPGIYPFYCDKQLLFFPNHREEGMEGRIIVGESSSENILK